MSTWHRRNCQLLTILWFIGVINGQSETPLIIDVTEGEDVLLECRFSPELFRKEPTLYWIRTNRKGHDNVAIGETQLQTNYRVEYKPEEGKYDLRISQANYDRDNGQFECRMKEGGTGIELHSMSVELTVLLAPSEPRISPANEAIATEGRPLNLTCQSIGGSPPPQILWYTEGQSEPLEASLIEGRNKDEPTQSVLTVIPRKEDDGNVYKCTVWNRALGRRQQAKLETSTKIFVNYFPRVSVGPANPLQVEKDETAQLECRVDAKPTVNNVKWTRNGRFIDTHFKHTIPRVTLQDSGIYVCSADNNLGQPGQTELKLEVLYGPIVTLTPAQRDFNEGDNIEVDCRVDANPRPSTIQWFKEGDERFVQNGPTLRLNGVTASNNGRYICSANNHLHPTGKGKLTRTGNATIDINIKHAPGKGFIMPDQPQAIDGRRLTLKCGADPPGYPKPQFRWWKEGGPDKAVGSEFTIETVRLANAGKYFCEPFNDFGKGSPASVDLEVNQAPKIITHLQSSISKRAGDTGFQITCQALGKPKPQVRWFKDGQEIRNADTTMYQITTTDQESLATMAHNVLSTLKYVGPKRISQMKLMPEDRGNYTCQFKNPVDSVESTMKLIVEHTPITVPQHNKVAFDLGQPAFISCKMQANPEPRFHWSFGNSILQNGRTVYDTNMTELGNDVYEGILRINQVTDSSYGDYTCRATNVIGNQKTIIKLQPRGKPEKPKDIYRLASGFNYITIGIEPGFDGGFNDTTHSLEYRRHDSSVPEYEDCSTRKYCNITGLEQHSRYFIKVKASNIKGESKYTQEVFFDTLIDVSQIPQANHVYYELSSNELSFMVQNNFLPLVAKIEVTEDNQRWIHVGNKNLEPSSSQTWEKEPIKVPNIVSARLNLCVASSSEPEDQVLCTPYVQAEFVQTKPAIQKSGLTMGNVVGIVIAALSTFIICIILAYCCCCKNSDSSNSGKKDQVGRPSIIHTTQQGPPPYHHGIENKGVDTLKDADEMIKNNFVGYNDHQSNSNSNSANGGSVNSQDSLWNVKGAPNAGQIQHMQQDPALMQQYAYQMQAQGYNVYDAIAMQQQQQHQQQHQQQMQQQYPEDYTHYPHPEEYLNERNQQFLNGEFYRHIPRPGGNNDSDYSPYGEQMHGHPSLQGGHPAYNQYPMGNEGFEEPQTPTQNYGQMSFEDAIDGPNSGSYNAGQQQRRVIREIIV